MIFATSASVMPYIKDHRVNALAVTSRERMKDLPMIPSMAESGLQNFEAVSWHGIVVPIGVSSVIGQQISNALQKALDNKEILQSFKSLGMEPIKSTPNEFKIFIQTEIPKWSKVVEASGASIY